MYIGLQDTHPSSRPGVVIAEMRCLRDKRAVLERKRYIRHMPQYQHVFVKASKSHTEQVIDANFNIMLNEMTNGDTYYVSDNGRIRKKTRYSCDDVRYTDQSQRSLNNGEHYESNLMVAPDLNQHSVMDMVRYMVTGTMITAEHVLVLIPQVILDMEASPGGQKPVNRVVMASLPQICTTMLITMKGRLMITQTMVITHNSIWTVS